LPDANAVLVNVDPSFVKRNVASVAWLNSSESGWYIALIGPFSDVKPPQIWPEVHESEKRVPTADGSGATLKECPAFVVDTSTDWPLYVPPASQSLPLPQLSNVVGENPFGIVN
jgi:hypothetical protein